jgi:hypothetical protein
VTRSRDAGLTRPYDLGPPACNSPGYGREGERAPTRAPATRTLRGWWPPVAVWIAALGALWAIALAHGHDPWHAATWSRWDSAHYAEIADHGYALHRCDTSWCGNTAWLPGYPLLMAGLHVLGVPLLTAGVALAWLCNGAVLVTLWHLFLRELRPFAAWGGLLFAGWAPGQVYDYAVYPLSLLVLLSVAYLHVLRQRRWILAGLAGAGAAATYPLGVALALTGPAWILLTVGRGRVRAIATACLPVAVGVAAVIAAQRIQTGRWTAYFDVERTYEHGLHDPFGAITNAVILWHRTQSLEPENVKGLQTLVVSAILLAVVAHAARRVRNGKSGARHGRGPCQAPEARGRGSCHVPEATNLFVIWALVTWAVPLTQGNISVQRSQAALAPLAVLVARLPRPLLLVAVAAVVALSEPVARLYFDGRLI